MISHAVNLDESPFYRAIKAHPLVSLDYENKLSKFSENQSALGNMINGVSKLNE